MNRKKLADVLAQPPRFFLLSITSLWLVRDDRNDDDIVVVFVERGQTFIAVQFDCNVNNTYDLTY